MSYNVGMSHLLRIVTVFALACSTLHAGDWRVRIEDDSTVQVLHRHAPIITAKYHFWGHDWNYDTAAIEVTPVDGTAGGRTFKGAVGMLALTLAGRIEPTAGERLVYHYQVNAGKQFRGIVGGGLQFVIDTASLALPPGASEPVLLQNNTGWRWNVGDGQAVTVQFDRTMPKVYFEQGKSNRIRAFFVGEEIDPGLMSFVMTVTLPRGTTLEPSLADRYGPANVQAWHADSLLWNASPVDLRFLNEGERPAGRRGFVRADGDRLVFDDGTPARFWGGNIAAGTLFIPSKEEIQQQAQRIAMLGYNLMRIHHHDSVVWVDPTVIDKSRTDSRHLNLQAMDKLDYWIKCLTDQGIYIWLDLHVGRRIEPGDGVKHGYDEIQRFKKKPEGFAYYNDEVRELMKEFNENYLRHVNAYTGRAYKDDPAIIGMLITNENDLTTHYGNLMLPDKKNPYHNRIFDEAVRAFCAAKGLPYDRTWRTWEPGPSKIFLNDRERLFNVDMIAHLRGLGVRAPIATTSAWGGFSLFSLPSLTVGDVVDIHSYGEPEALSTSPRYVPNFIADVASAHVHGKPVSITEWNVPFPAIDRFTSPLYMSSIACLQGWDAPMIYNYSQRGFRKPERVYKWSTYPDPAITAIMPAAAIAYRRQDVKPARKHYMLKVDADTFFGKAVNASSSATIRTLAEMSRITVAMPESKALDWLKPAGTDAVTVVEQIDRDFIPSEASEVVSDTGELRRDWARGVQTIDTPLTQAAQGWIGGEVIRLGDVTLRVTTSKAVVALTSLDGKPLGQSGRILITTVARVLPSEGNMMPWLAEPVRGTIQLRTGRAGQDLKLLNISPTGEQTAGAGLTWKDGGICEISLDDPHATHWRLLAAP